MCRQNRRLIADTLKSILQRLKCRRGKTNHEGNEEHEGQYPKAFGQKYFAYGLSESSKCFLQSLCFVRFLFFVVAKMSHYTTALIQPEF
jgi:hypothetical protein